MVSKQDVTEHEYLCKVVQKTFHIHALVIDPSIWPLKLYGHVAHKKDSTGIRAG